MTLGPFHKPMSESVQYVKFHETALFLRAKNVQSVQRSIQFWSEALRVHITLGPMYYRCEVCVRSTRHFQIRNSTPRHWRNAFLKLRNGNGTQSLVFKKERNGNGTLKSERNGKGTNLFSKFSQKVIIELF